MGGCHGFDVVEGRPYEPARVIMSHNTFGHLFRVTTFGESHGPGIGCVVDGCPPRIPLEAADIQADLDRRRPGTSRFTTQRREPDEARILSGVMIDETTGLQMTTGAPIGVFIDNVDQRSKDYSEIKDKYRPGHADYAYQAKYGIRDYRGGGRSSARETAARVAAGALAKLLLKTQGIEIVAHVSSVGKINAPNVEIKNAQEFIDEREKNIVRCADPATAEEMIEFIDSIRKQGDTVGGKVSCYVQNCPVGLGEPVFDKLHADLGKAMLSINAVHGFEYGSGFAGSEMRGSEHNDIFLPKGEESSIKTITNFSGGIQ